MAINRFEQNVMVYRGHHDPNPDRSTVGRPTWSNSPAAADVYSRYPSVDGMEAKNPTVSARRYTSHQPYAFDYEHVDVGADLGEDLEFSPQDMAYISDKYGEAPRAWEIMLDPKVQEMFVNAGVDMVTYPETFASRGLVRAEDGSINQYNQIQTVMPLGAEFGETHQYPQVASWQGNLGQMLYQPVKKLYDSLQEWHVWHGSPHKFDRFSATYLHTGEGASYRGAGIYLAEQPETARWYMPQGGMDDYAVQIQTDYDMMMNEGWHEAARAYEMVMEGAELEDVKKYFDHAWVQMTDAEQQQWETALSNLEEYEALKDPGSLYQVKVTADRDMFLDLDEELGLQEEPLLKALNEAWPEDHYGYMEGLVQVEEDGPGGRWYAVDEQGNVSVQSWASEEEAVKAVDAGEAYWEGFHEGLTGDEYYDGLVSYELDQLQLQHDRGEIDLDEMFVTDDPRKLADGMITLAKKRASKRMLDAGIPGASFLDQNSRFGTQEDPTRNLVLYDDSYIEILDRNGNPLDMRLEETAETLQDVPDVPQHNIARVRPARADYMPESIKEIITPDNTRRVKNLARKGLSIGAKAWYNTMPFRRVAREVLGEVEGDKFWTEFLNYFSATSPQTKVAENFRRASFFNWRIRGEQGKGDVPTDLAPYFSRIYGEQNVVQMNDGSIYVRPPGDPIPAKDLRKAGMQRHPDNKDFVGPVRMSDLESVLDQTPELNKRGAQQPSATHVTEPKFGHKLHKSQSANIVEMRDQGDYAPESNPKIAGFRQGLLGNYLPIAADIHYNRAIGLVYKSGKKIGQGKDAPTPIEYGFIEDWTQEMAAELGVSPAQFQAAVWMAADSTPATDVADIRIFMQMLNSAIDKTAHHRGHSYHKVLMDFLHGRAPLFSVPPVFMGVFGSLAGEEEEGPDA